MDRAVARSATTNGDMRAQGNRGRVRRRGERSPPMRLPGGFSPSGRLRTWRDKSHVIE